MLATSLAIAPNTAPAISDTPGQTIADRASAGKEYTGILGVIPSAARSFTLAAAGPNKAPTIGGIANVNLNEDDPTQTAALSGITSGSVSENQVLTVSAISNNPGLIANPTVAYTSPNSTGTLSFTPVANANGTALITVTVNDGEAANNIFSRTFTVTVTPVNDPPTLDAIANVTITEGAPRQTVNMSGIGSGAADESQRLTVAATSSNTALIPDPTVAYTSPNTTGTLSFTPEANASGSVVITVTVNDGAAANNTFSRTFSVSINAVNKAPTIGAIANVNLNEDDPTQTAALSGITSGSVSENQVLTVSATSNNPGLIANPTVVYNSPNATGTLSFTPVANANGTAVITVAVDDAGPVNNIASTSFTVTVAAVNDAPALGPISDVSLSEDAGALTVDLSAISSGAANESQTLTVTATSSNTALIPNPTVAYASPTARGTLNFTPVANASGTAVITVTVNDGGAANNTVSTSFTVTVTPVNDPPTLDAIVNVTISEGAPPQTVNLSGIGSGGANESQTLTVTATSSNTALIPNPTVAYTSPDATATLSFAPVANVSGTVVITVTVNDGAAVNNTFSRTFSVSFNAVNKAPTIGAIANVSLNEDDPSQTAALSGISSGSVSENQVLTVSATSNNPGLIASPTVAYTSPNAAGTLSFTPVANASGTALITVMVDDGAAANNIFSRTFTVTVTPVNDPPTLDAIVNVTISEGAPPQTVNLSGIGSGGANESQTLTVTATSSNTALIPNPTVAYTSPNATATLSFTPAANASGTAVITVIVNDGAAANNTFSRTFTVTVSSVNNPVALDYGDAPDPTFPTALRNNGARHRIVQGVFLGSAIDAEVDGKASTDALGDDAGPAPALDDEDGVVFSRPLIPGALASITVTASISGGLDAWVDFNINGSWAEPADQIFVNKPLVAGVNTLTFTAPTSAKPGFTFARFRFSQKGGLPFFGPATEGEVEDYRVPIGQGTAPCDLTNKGTDFWLTFPANYAPNPTNRPELNLHLAGLANVQGQVTIPGLAFATNWTIPASGVATVNLPWMADLGELNDGVTNKGVHITAGSEIAVYALNYAPFTSDAFLGLPSAVLGTEYIVLGYSNVYTNVPELNGTQFAIVATEDSTTVTITPSVPTGVHMAGFPFNVAMNRGDTYQLRNTNDVPADLSGTIITANKPIGVFGSHQCANVTGAAQFFCDNLVEQLLPTAAWGTNFVSMPLATRLNGDTYRIVAAQADTLVKLNGAVVASLDRGKVHEQIVTNSVHITSDKPVLVAQYANSSDYDSVMNSDPFMVLIPATKLFCEDYIVFSMTNGFTTNFVNVVVPNSLTNQILLDGILVPSSQFSPIPATGTPSGFSGAQLGVAPGKHTLTQASPNRQPFGATVYGFGQYISYGYPAGMCSDCTKDTVTVEPTIVITTSTTGSINLAWSLGGTLQETADLFAPFKNTPNAQSPYVVQPAAPGAVSQRFFRVLYGGAP